MFILQETRQLGQSVITCIRGTWLIPLGMELRVFAGRAQGPPRDTEARRRVRSSGSQSEWTFCNHPLQISQEERSPSTHLYTQKFYTAHTPDMCTADAGLAGVKENWVGGTERNW